MRHLAIALIALFTLPVQAQDTEESILPIEAIRRLSDTFEHIRRNYIEEVSDDELLNLAIHGMLEGLDPHSAYLEPEQLADLKESTEGEFSGLGLEIEMDGGLVRVVSPIDGTPAAIAGVQAGDLIIKLDNTQVRGLTLSQAIDIMRGERGTEITLTILRGNDNAPETIVVTRDIIQVASVRSEWLEPSFAYVRIASFQKDTGAELREQLNKMAAEDINGAILDLRNNPGGVLTAAVDVSDAFIEDGTIVYTEGRNESEKSLYEASVGDLLNNKPIVVLINEGSASASEIVAGALQDNNRAIIAGARSFGKGSVQRVLPLSEDYAIKLTTSLYFTPNGISIQAHGIMPDIEIPRAEVTPIESNFDFSERSLATHLVGENEGKQTEAVQKSSRLADDYQLSAALKILKGASFYQQPAPASNN